MLSVTILLLLVSQVLCGDTPVEVAEELAVFHKECQEKTGVDENVILEARKLNWPEPPNDAEMKCYAGCIFEKMKLFKDDDTVDVDYIDKILPPSIRDFIIAVRECGTQVGADRCEIAYNTLRCYYDKDSERAFVV